MWESAKELVTAVSDPVAWATERRIRLGGLDPVDPRLLDEALDGFRNEWITGPGGIRVILDRRGMARILQRHHPRYFNADSARGRNTSLLGR